MLRMTPSPARGEGSIPRTLRAASPHEKRFPMEHSDTIDWTWQGQPLRLGVTRMGAGPTLLLLPALSSISTR
jgi:hypothetical protein